MKSVVRSTILAIALLSASLVSAQPQSLTPSQIALLIDNVINQWAQAIEVLQAQNAQLRARVKELEDKYEPKEQK